MQRFMSYYHFMKPDSWNGFRDIDEKIDFEELNRQLEDGEIMGGGIEDDLPTNPPPPGAGGGNKKDGK
jgi:hypothetical protein